MKVIETTYKGYKFRSRTEARWAVFFDALGFKYEYEKEGYVLDNGVWYLPDFYFPEYNFHAEVKGLEFTAEEIEKCRLLSKNNNQVILLEGPPEEKHYDAYDNGVKICSVVFTSGKYSPLFYGSFSDYFDDTIEAIKKSRAARF